MIAYYEKQAKYPPTHLLPLLAEVLGTSADELLGMKKLNLKDKKRICACSDDSVKLKKWIKKKNAKYYNF